MSAALALAGPTPGVQGAERTLVHVSNDGLDRTTLLLVAILIDDILDALELWQSVGDSDGSWVKQVWSRRVLPWIGLDLPRSVRRARDTATVHRELMAWQTVIIERLD